jgi:hypothetical protein
MTTDFDSFDESPLGAFVESPLGARNALASASGPVSTIWLGIVPHGGLGYGYYDLPPVSSPEVIAQNLADYLVDRPIYETYMAQHPDIFAGLVKCDVPATSHEAPGRWIYSVTGADNALFPRNQRHPTLLKQNFIAPDLSVFQPYGYFAPVRKIEILWGLIDAIQNRPFTGLRILGRTENPTTGMEVEAQLAIQELIRLYPSATITHDLRSNSRFLRGIIGE